jgi:polyferredoxin
MFMAKKDLMATSTVPPAEAPQIAGAPAKPKKRLVRRLIPDRSQQTRRAVQFAFLLLNGFLGIQFLMWVRYFESHGATTYVDRPAGVDGWLPIAGLINLRYFIATRHIPEIHPAALILFAVFLAASLLLKKAFCSWLCPVGTMSEYLWKLGRKLFHRNLDVPRWLDIALRSLKYLLLAFFLFIVFTMPVDGLIGFLMSPFGIVADVKMLNFFRYLGTVGLGVIMLLVALSVVIQNFWCRYLCPYGALMGIVSALSPVKIRRDAEACIDCGKCNKACPSHLPVDQLVQIHSLECTACMECVAACPAENALQFSLVPRKPRASATPAQNTVAARWKNRALKPWTVAAMLALIFFGLVGAARITNHWQTNLTRDIYMELVPNANNFEH